MIIFLVDINMHQLLLSARYTSSSSEKLSLMYFVCFIDTPTKMSRVLTEVAKFVQFLADDKSEDSGECTEMKIKEQRVNKCAMASPQQILTK